MAMRRFLTVLALAALLTGVWRTHGEAHATTGGCGDAVPGGIKALSDPQRRLVDLRPRATTVGAINVLRRPGRIAGSSHDAFERHVWRVRAVIVKDRLGAGGNIELILVSRHWYMRAEMPAPQCLRTTTRARAAILRSRRRFQQGCGTAHRAWRSQGAVAYISGVGFWEAPSRKLGHAKNYAELNPVTDIKFVVGCDRP
jgi:hypothetical protein